MHILKSESSLAAFDGFFDAPYRRPPNAAHGHSEAFWTTANLHSSHARISWLGGWTYALEYVNMKNNLMKPEGGGRADKGVP